MYWIEFSSWIGFNNNIFRYKKLDRFIHGHICLFKLIDKAYLIYLTISLYLVARFLLLSTDMNYRFIEIVRNI